MTPNTFNSRKNTPNTLSTQVKEILNSKGLSKIFNFQDYNYYKSQVNSAFNKAQAIAELFTADYGTEQSDFNEYVF